MSLRARGVVHVWSTLPATGSLNPHDFCGAPDRSRTCGLRFRKTTQASAPSGHYGELRDDSAESDIEQGAPECNTGAPSDVPREGGTQSAGIPRACDQARDDTHRSDRTRHSTRREIGSASRVQVSELVPRNARSGDANGDFAVNQTGTRDSTPGDIVLADPVATQWDGDRLRSLAEIYLRAVAIGAPANELAETLATAVLGSELVRLAQVVLAGGEFRAARATELARKILDAVSLVGADTVTEGKAEP